MEDSRCGSDVAAKAERHSISAMILPTPSE